MNPFEAVEIGATGVTVTRLGLGGAPLGGMILADGVYRGCGHDEAVAIIRRAYKLGVRYFDTAPLYGEGRSEARYGRVLNRLPRDTFACSTKVSRLLELADPNDATPREGDGIPRYACRFDFSAGGVRASLASSLERLRLEAVDILLVHDSDFVGQHEDDVFVAALEAARELRAEGAVRAIGMGMNEWERTARMIKRFDLDFVLLAGRYTLLDQTALPELMPLCMERGVRLAIGGPYNSGILARDLDRPVSFDYARAPEALVAKARRLKAACERHGVDLRAAALQFACAHPAVATVVPGAASVRELEDNVRLMLAPIPADLWRDLKEHDLLPAEAPTPA